MNNSQGCCSKRTPHKHAELIKLWADGAEIEYLTIDNVWIPILDPMWHENSEYRIKPIPKPDVIRYLGFESLDEVDGYTLNHWLSDSYFVVNHWNSVIKLVFDGETGKLKEAKVL